MILCFFDTETTGLNHNKHEIIEYSIIVHINDEQKFRRTRRVKPLRINEADPDALKINTNPKATKEYIIPDIKPFKTVSIKFSNSTLMN